MFQEALPVKWDVTNELPLLNVLHEFPNYTAAHQIQTLDLLDIFNVEVIVPQRYQYAYPDFATLIFELATNTRAILVDVPMKLDETRKSYEIVDPVELAFNLEREIEAFQEANDTNFYVKPELTLKEMSGFQFDENSVINFRITGIPVAYNIRFGSVVVQSGFQWGGKPDSLPLRYPQLPFLSE